MHYKCPCGGIGIHGRLRACAFLGVLVRVQSGAFLEYFKGLISPFFVPIPSTYRFGRFGLLRFQPSPQKQDHNYDLFL